MFTSELLSSMKDIPSTQRMAEVSVRWKTLSDAVRDKYNKEAARVRTNSMIQFSLVMLPGTNYLVRFQIAHLDRVGVPIPKRVQNQNRSL